MRALRVSARLLSTPAPKTSPPPPPTPPPTVPSAAAVKALIAALPRPSVIAAHLDTHVVGQAAAKRALAVALHTHYKRVTAIGVAKRRAAAAAADAAAAARAEDDAARAQEAAAADPRIRQLASPAAHLARLGGAEVGTEDVLSFLAAKEKEAERGRQGALVPRGLDLPAVVDGVQAEVVCATGEVELDKSNCLLLGPTGSGKTHLAQTLARGMNVPFCIADATALTAAGYVGSDTDTILVDLVKAAGGDVKKAETGIVYLDEADKLAARAAGPSLSRDVGGSDVQQALLKMIEGCVLNIPEKAGRKHPSNDTVRIDTSGILFIFGGAFVGLDKIIAERTAKRGIGFGATVVGKAEEEERRAGVLELVEAEDLQKFGLIPELIGRLPLVVALEALDLGDLVRILTEPKNAIVKQFRELLAMDGADLHFTDAALRAIATTALDKGTGARGLRQIMERVLGDVMYEVPDHAAAGPKTVVVAEEVGEGKTSVEARLLFGDGALKRFLAAHGERVQAGRREREAEKAEYPVDVAA